MKGIEIHEQIDASVREGLHTTAVVGQGINMVDANGISAQLGHAHDVPLALFRVYEGIIGDELVGDACSE